MENIWHSHFCVTASLQHTQDNIGYIYIYIYQFQTKIRNNIIIWDSEDIKMKCLED